MRDYFVTVLAAIVWIAFALVVILFLGSCAGTIHNQRETQRLISSTVCSVALATCDSGVFPDDNITEMACIVVLAACASGENPDTSESQIDAGDGAALHGMLPGVFRCPEGAECRLAHRAADFWNAEFREQFGENFPDVALVGPSGWITISEDVALVGPSGWITISEGDLPPHAKGSEQDLDNSNAGLMRGPTLLGITDYTHVDGLIDKAHITLQRREWRDVDLYHEAGHALFGYKNRRGRGNIMSTPPHIGYGLVRDDAFSTLEHCVFIE
jgi:hypothetical protein